VARISEGMIPPILGGPRRHKHVSCCVRILRPRALKCVFVRCGIDDWRHASDHDPIVWFRDPAPGAVANDLDGTGRSRQRDGGAGASASDRGAAPAGASSGFGPGGSGGVGRAVAAVAKGAVSGVIRHPRHAVAVASQPGRAAVELSRADHGHRAGAGVGAEAGLRESDARMPTHPGRVGRSGAPARSERTIWATLTKAGVGWRRDGRVPRGPSFSPFTPRASWPVTTCTWTRSPDPHLREVPDPHLREVSDRSRHAARPRVRRHDQPDG
jgi:hypothetical protein